MLPALPFIAALPLLVSVDQGACGVFKKFQTKIDIEFITSDIEYDYSRTKNQLTGGNRERIVDNWQGGQADREWGAADLEISGYARGAVDIQSVVNFRAEPFDRYGKYFCPYIQSVKVKVNYGSKIYMAKELKKGSCEFGAVKQHELKHHEANMSAVKNIVKKLKHDLPVIISGAEGTHVLKNDVHNQFKRMKSDISEAIDIYSDYTSLEMKNSNQLIDTIEEYKRVSKQCK